MDNTIDDFFNEINDLEQLKQSKHKQSVWQECYDELTGYSYYWNTKTDEVTWNTPPEFKPDKSKNQTNSKPQARAAKKELYIPPNTRPALPSTSKKVSEASVKIYSIVEGSEKNIKSLSRRNDNSSLGAKKRRESYSRNSDSEDEKIELITSYGSETDSESEESNQGLKNEISGTPKDNDSNASDEDDTDLLTKIQKRAKELKEMGGDLPPEVAKVVNIENITRSSSPEKDKDRQSKNSTFSLVAGYSDSEEEENEEIRSLFPVAPSSPKMAASTLFPITKPIDVKDFTPQPPAESKPKSPSSDFDSKAFQRKRRIGVALVNAGKRKEAVSVSESDAKGLGFKDGESTVSGTKDNVYAGFRKGGVMFVKSDVLNPSLAKTEEGSAEGKDDGKEEEIRDVKQTDLEEIYATLKEKLGFLSEGRPQVSPVQVMFIQAETLFNAMKGKGLKPSYLQRWLTDTHSDLLKLEREAAPDGWLLQWDRSHKRYYYQHQTTGESQWEYPQPDISRCDEAMDISTTPPPVLDAAIHLSPPLPPAIRSPTPPPPPIISKKAEEGVTTLPEVPLPPETKAPTKFVDNGEPLPPGVDLPEIIAFNKPTESEPKPADPLFSALDSFYSDIASIENQNSSSSPPLPPPPPAEENKTVPESPAEPPKKKKKTKVKLAPGLAMKKKGVSQLVEKWKTVQQHYND